MDSTLKVVYYNKYGAFQLPKEVAIKLAEEKGIKLVKDDEFSVNFFPEMNVAMPFLGWMPQTDARLIQRHDPVLVRLAEEWISKHGEEFGLAIKEIPKGKYIIHEYDGLEKVICPSDIPWIKPE